MRKALENPARQQAVVQNSIPTKIPAPVLGWNLTQPLSAMDPRYAVKLDNWIARPGYCELRKGQIVWTTGLPGNVDSFLPYQAAAASKLFAASGTGIYDVTANGAVGAAVKAITSPQFWDSANFVTPAGSFLIGVNGTDTPVQYDGTTWSNSTMTGVTTSTLMNVAVFKQRLWFIQRSSMSAWYLAAGAITGALTEFPLGNIFRKGGHLVGIGTWSIDAGTGLNDMLVFITDQGECAVYNGTDPSSASTFALIGVYQLPKPIGRRCLLKLGGDVMVLTQQGVYPLAKALQTSSINRTIAVSYNISPQFVTDFASFGNAYGWEMCFYPEDNLLIVNVPEADDNTNAAQYVMNTINGAWSRFRAIPARCWVDFNGVLYYGGNGQTCQALQGTADLLNANVTGELLCAYNYFAEQLGLKHFKLIRPLLVVSNPIQLQLALAVDYQPIPDYQYASMDELLAVYAAGALWDVALWDQAVYGFNTFNSAEWKTVAQRPGYAIAAGLRVMTNYATVQLVSFDLAYELGGLL